MRTLNLNTALLIATTLMSSLFALASLSRAEDLVPPDSKLETLWTEGEFTEGCAVSPDGLIYFSDISMSQDPGRILRFDPATRSVDVFCRDSGKSNGLMFDARGNLIAACGANFGRRSLALIRPDGSVQDLVTHFEKHRFNAPNDLVIHPSGNIYFSDPRYVGAEPLELDQQSVYRFDPRTKSVHRVTNDVNKPNGVCLSPDAKTLYVADTDNGDDGLPDLPKRPRRMMLSAFTIQPDASLDQKKTLVDFGTESGIDGMTVDQNGHIYAAVRKESRFGIGIFTPEGKDAGFIPTPEPPTNCSFGAADEVSTLYITAGKGLYRIKLSIPGHDAVALKN